MPSFTIDTTYLLPVYRRRDYEADTIEQACALALDDDDWSDENHDYECARETHISDIRLGQDGGDRGPALPVPQQFAETLRLKADYFEVLLGILKILAQDEDRRPSAVSYWIRRAQTVIAKAEAILAGAPDPDAASGATVPGGTGDAADH